MNWNSKKIKNKDNKISLISTSSLTFAASIDTLSKLNKIITIVSPPMYFDKQNILSNTYVKSKDVIYENYVDKHISKKTVPNPNIYKNKKNDILIKNIGIYLIPKNKKYNSPSEQPIENGRIFSKTAIAGSVK
ncbi:MAG: hypothetical protein ACYC9D_13165 [Candidatus Dormibacteria bacterium]